MKPVHIVEAALFSAGRPLAVDEIVQETGLPQASVTKAIRELQKAYEERDTVIEVGKAGAKWAMQVRRQAAEPAAKFAAMEIAPKLLKTLALIAYHQPMKQSDLKEMVGPRVYDHVPELQQRGLVRTRRDGQTKILSTTAAFPEYFGLDAATPQQIRVALAKAVGLDPAAEARKAGQLEGYDKADAPMAMAATGDGEAHHVPEATPAGAAESTPEREAHPQATPSTDEADAQAHAFHARGDAKPSVQDGDGTPAMATPPQT